MFHQNVISLGKAPWPWSHLHHNLLVENYMEKLRLKVCHFSLETTPLICSLYQIFCFIQRYNHVLDGASNNFISVYQWSLYSTMLHLLSTSTYCNWLPFPEECLCLYSFKCLQISWAFRDFIGPGTKCAAGWTWTCIPISAMHYPLCHGSDVMGS